MDRVPHMTKVSQAVQEDGQAHRSISLGDRRGFCYADVSGTVFAEHHLFSEVGPLYDVNKNESQSE